MTPMQIMWCVVYHTRGNPVADLGHEHFNSPVGREVLDWLVIEGLIVWSQDEGTKSVLRGFNKGA